MRRGLPIKCMKLNWAEREREREKESETATEKQRENFKKKGRWLEQEKKESQTTDSGYELWDTGVSTREEMVNLNILQRQIHSCFCVHANHNYGWPSLTTTALAGWLFFCFVLLCFFFFPLKGRLAHSTSLSILIYRDCARAADMGEQSQCMLRRGTCCSTGRDFTHYSLSLLAFSPHTEWTRGKRLWLCSQYSVVIQTEFKGIPDSNNN